jgi:uncharacterized membrane protein YdbT with pleckstrin-like domain
MTAEHATTPRPLCTEKRRLLFAGLPLTLTHYEIDGEFLSERTGLFSVTTKTVCLSHIKNMVVMRSAIQKLFGLSTIRVATTDPNLPEFVVRHIRNGDSFAAILQNARENVSLLQPLATDQTPEFEK